MSSILQHIGILSNGLKSHSRKMVMPFPTRTFTRTYASIPPVVYRPVPVQYRRFNNSQPFYKSKRLWVFVGTGTVMFGGYYVTHLEKVPISGRTRFMSCTPSQEEAMAKQAYIEVMSQFGNRILPAYHPYSIFVSKVAKRLVRVSGMDHMQWEFHVIDSPERNAFVLPGGKIFVFTGILPIVQNEDGMAAVLGHEIAHQLARHSAEKLSFAKILLAGQFTLMLIGIDPSFIFNNITLNFMMMMPFSRKCETEADDIGLKLMAKACFNPEEATRVWRRMELASKDQIPQFASTHPSNKNRIVHLEKEMPAAIEERNSSDCSTELKGFTDMLRSQWVRW
ncbi:peptidase family M48-domain-containing protein [Phycomyces blakesleeanus]|uniref:Peptidase family M48-domain-containing protein n=1 Tax=Phycomyces blakesleeanus TaxID=4837 RepID=A0ABR3BIU8_PHYBL